MMFQILVDAGMDLEKFLKNYDKTKPIAIKSVLGKRMFVEIIMNN